MGRILIVDDELPVRQLLTDILEMDGHEVRAVADGVRALEAVQAWNPHALVLDLELGGSPTGADVCQRIRDDPERSRLGILVLTGRTDDGAEMGLFDAGADDYVRKQRFDAGVFRKRLGALLGRLRARPTAPRVLSWGPLTLCPERVEAHLRDRPLNLTRTQMRMLELLVESQGGIVLRRTLFEECAPACDPRSSRAVDVQVKQIRKQLGPDRGLIRAAYGSGYRLAGTEPKPAPRSRRVTPATA